MWWVGGRRAEDKSGFFFFFKQKTAYEIGTGDWSSDVCSSDLKWLVPMFFCLGTEGSKGSLLRNGWFQWFSVWELSRKSVV